MNWRTVLKCWNFPHDQHLELWPPQWTAWIEFCLFIALCKYYLWFSVPLAQVGMEPWEGRGDFPVGFPNSSLWLQADGIPEHSANWGVIPAYVGWGEPANPHPVILWAPDTCWGRMTIVWNMELYIPCVSHPTACSMVLWCSSESVRNGADVSLKNAEFIHNLIRNGKCCQPDQAGILASCFSDIWFASICVWTPLVILRKHSVVFNFSEAKLNKLSVIFFQSNMEYLRLVLSTESWQLNAGVCFWPINNLNLL